MIEWPDVKILFAMDMTVTLAVGIISEKVSLSTEEVLIDFMKSRTASMLYDDSTKFWWDGPQVVAREYLEEKNIKVNWN